MSNESVLSNLYKNTETIFTDGNYNYEDIKHKKFEIEYEIDGEKFKKDVYAPDFWDQMSVRVAYVSYMLPTIGICDYTDKEGELNVLQLINRVALGLTYTENSNYYALRAFSELKYMLAHQYLAPNTPQWLNTGVYEFSKISPAKGVPIEKINAYFDNNKSGYKVFSDDPSKAVVVSSTRYPQTTACFILGLEDSLIDKSGIFDTIITMAKIFKRGSGVGVNVSNLRPKKTKLTSGGHSSGPLSFVLAFDEVSGCIKSGGSTRRAALMITIDASHLDVREFITLKWAENIKLQEIVQGSKNQMLIFERILYYLKSLPYDQAQSIISNISTSIYKHDDSSNYLETIYGNDEDLKTKYHNVLNVLNEGVINNSINFKMAFTIVDTINVMYFGDEAGFDNRVNKYAFAKQSTSFIGDTVSSLRGQNFNLSITMTDEEVETRDDLLLDIATASHNCGDPAIIFIDQVNKYNMLPNVGRIVSSNPCGEYFHINDTACNLLSINLQKFLQYDGKYDGVFEDHSLTLELEQLYLNYFNYDLFRRVVKFATVVLDASIEIASFPDEAVAYNSYHYRPLGLGFTSMAYTMAALGIPYTRQGDFFPAAISAIMTSEVYSQSYEMVSEQTPAFKDWEKNKEAINNVFELYIENARMMKTQDYRYINFGKYTNSLEHAFEQISDSIPDFDQLQHRPLRNSQATCIAPTGTISFILGAKSQGIEPYMGYSVYKKTVTGDIMQMPCDGLKFMIFNQLSAILGEYQETVTNINDFDLKCASVVLADKFIKSKKPDEYLLELLKNHLSSEYNLNVNFDNINLEYIKIANSSDKLSFSYKNHIDVMSAAQLFITGGISKTINLPFNASVQDVLDCYKYGYEKKLKGITIFRDQCKGDQPMNTNSEGSNYTDRLANLVGITDIQANTEIIICIHCGAELKNYKGSCSVCTTCGAAGGCG